MLATLNAIAYGLNATPIGENASARLAALPQAEDTTAADTALAAVGEDGSVLLWDLIGQAGGFQYPIFIVFVIGLFLIFAKVYELYTDRREAKALEEAPLAQMGMKRITRLVANQRQSMLAELQATMLNVFQTSRDANTLHEEIANFIQFQRDRFDTFKRRVDFLSDTAGALGLLGTVWGMFTVFSGNIEDKQAILGGMGVALVSTLLGLIASIILNLSSTEVYSFFDKRLDQIEDKSDELRFRLMELAMSGDGVATPVPEAPSAAPAEATHDGRMQPVETAAAAQPAETSMPAAEPEAATAAVETAPAPHRLEAVDVPASAPVGSTLRGVRLKLTDEAGDAVVGETVRLAVRDGSGTIEPGPSSATLQTDDRGEVTFDWQLPTEAGRCTVAADVPEADASDTSVDLSVAAEAGPPEQYAQSGNNQGAEVGQALPKPLRVRLRDAHDNPVAGYPVTFRVETGSGTFEDGSQHIEIATDDEGVAATAFVTGDEPGLNTVVAVVDDKEIKFQTMALEA